MRTVGDLIAPPQSRTEDACEASFDRFHRAVGAWFRIVGLRRLASSQGRREAAHWLAEVADELYDMVRDARYAWRELRAAS